MRKGVAIPYIIALILGIAVIALLGYWFFVLGGSFTGKASLEECRSRLSTYCSAYSAAGYPTSYTFFTGNCGYATGTYAPQCCTFNTELQTGGSWLSACKAYLGQT